MNNMALNFLFWQVALLDEQAGKSAEAREAYKEVAETLAPNDVEYVLRWANFERRVGSDEEVLSRVCSVYEVCHVFTSVYVRSVASSQKST